MKTILTILLVWLGLSILATWLVFFRGWRNSKADPDDAAEENSRR